MFTEYAQHAKLLLSKEVSCEGEQSGYRVLPATDTHWLASSRLMRALYLVRLLLRCLGVQYILYCVTVRRVNPAQA